MRLVASLYPRTSVTVPNAITVDFSQLATPDGIVGACGSVSHETLMHFIVAKSTHGSIECETVDGKVLSLPLSDTGVSCMQAAVVDEHVVIALAPEIVPAFGAGDAETILSELCRLCVAAGRELKCEGAVVILLSAQNLPNLDTGTLQARCKERGVALYTSGRPGDDVVEPGSKLFIVHAASDLASTNFWATSTDTGVELECRTARDVGVQKDKAAAVASAAAQVTLTMKITLLCTLSLLVAGVVYYLSIPRIE